VRRAAANDVRQLVRPVPRSMARSSVPSLVVQPKDNPLHVPTVRPHRFSGAGLAEGDRPSCDRPRRQTSFSRYREALWLSVPPQRRTGAKAA
jgi:hypothetical protein